MKTLMLLVALLTAGPALATTITFDPGANTAGWTYDYQQVITTSFWQGEHGNTEIPFPSGNYAAYNAFGIESLAFNGPLSTVEGVWLAPWTAFNDWYDPYSAHAVTIDGYADGLLVGSTSFQLTPGFQFAEPGFAEPVDRMVFHTGASTDQWYLFDDLTLTVLPQPSVWREPGQGAVPEPASWLFVGVGLLLIISTSLVITHAKTRL